MERSANTVGSIAIAGSVPPSLADSKPRSNAITGRKLWTFRLTAMIGGLAVAMIIAEVALRIAGWPAPGFYRQGSGPIELRLPGKDGGAFPPETRGELRHYDYSVECNVNRYGFRDREVTAKQPDERRIGILGDSFTVGVGVEEQQRFASLFAASVHQARPNATVWNLSAPNCGTGCESEMFEAVRSEYGLDEVVLAFYAGNDLQDNQIWLEAESARPQDNTPRFTAGRTWLREHCRLASFLWVSFIRAWTRSQPEGIYTTAELEHYWPATEASLARLLQNVRGQSLTILYLPARPEWDDGAWQDTQNNLRTSDLKRFLTRDAISRWASDHGVRFVDATPWLHACQPAAQCVFATDPHWTATAHRLVANGLIDYWNRQN